MLQHLLRYVNDDEIQQNCFYCKELCEANNLMSCDNIWKQKGLSMENFVGMCTNIAPSVVFLACKNETCCFIHGEVLVSNTTWR